MKGARLGLATAVVMIVAWFLARWHDFDYTFGTSRVPTQIWERVNEGVPTQWWIPVALISLIPGALAAAVAGDTLWIRGEEASRYWELGIGGVGMGIGAAIAGGCNLGHAMVGVPLLSMGSIVTTMAIVGGVFLGDRGVRVFDRYRGTRR